MHVRLRRMTQCIARCEQRVVCDVSLVTASRPPDIVTVPSLLLLPVFVVNHSVIASSKQTSGCQGYQHGRLWVDPALDSRNITAQRNTTKSIHYELASSQGKYAS